MLEVRLKIDIIAIEGNLVKYRYMTSPAWSSKDFDANNPLFAERPRQVGKDVVT